MISKFKTLGVALVAVLALTAVAAATASAEANYTASSYPTTGTGESAVGNDTFITEAGKVECKSHFAGTLSAASSTLTVTPTYTSCKAFGFLSAKIHMNGCDYLFGTPTKPVNHASSANVSVICPAGKAITITAPETNPVCVADIGDEDTAGKPINQNLAKVDITNNTAAGDVSVQATVKGIQYLVTTDGFGCPFNGTGHKTGAEYIQHSPITFDSTNGATIDVG